jgi:cytochrome c biogenesis protein
MFKIQRYKKTILHKLNFLSLLTFISSMRFAIAMLVLIAISSVIGTILKQNDPYTTYVIRFGEFWTSIFMYFNLHQVYSAWWFLGILFFLVLSTCLCITRTWPKFYKQLKLYQLNVRKEFLLQQKMHAVFDIKLNTHNLNITKVDDFQTHLFKKLQQHKFKWRIKTYDENKNNYLIAAKQGKANKWGYLCAHIGIVVICIGGLIDGNLPLKIQQMLGKIQPFQTAQSNENILPQKAILDENNMSFRANLFIPEQESSDLAIINTSNGVLGQKLPFQVELKRFMVEYYSTGMPKRFLSEIKIHDIKNNKKIETTLEVNKPFNYRGFNFFQASFEDGGSTLQLKPYLLKPYLLNTSTQNLNTANIDIQVSKPQKISIQEKKYQLEITNFRAINVHDLKESVQNNVTSKQQFQSLHGNSANLHSKKFTNVGPSIEYSLRDDSGQLSFYHIYMLPLQINQHTTYLIGTKDSLNAEFKYLHIPADDKQKIDTWLMLYHYLQNDDMRKQAALNYAKTYAKHVQSPIFESSYKALNIFNQDGLLGISNFISKNVTPKEQEKASGLILEILQNSLWELWQLSHAANITSEKTAISPTLTPLVKNSANLSYLQRSLIAMSDVKLFKAPLWLGIQNFNEKKASVIQITKAPGQNIVYIGCLLLVIGVFLMLFIQEKRLWILCEKNINDINDKSNSNNININIAMQFQKRHFHNQQHFEEICRTIKSIANHV